MSWPPPVKPGDAVSLIAPAGPIDEKLLRSGCSVLQKWGLRTVVHQSAASSKAYLAGSDEERASAFLEAFNDPSTKAVICIRGGYGCTRILSHLHQMLHSTPQNEGEDISITETVPSNWWSKFMGKRFLGFSDITALHSFLSVEFQAAFPSKPACITFHAPMPGSTLFSERGSQAARKALKDALFAESVELCCPPLQGRCLRNGNAEDSGRVCGRLVGGNLTMLCALVGTPWEIDLDGAILLLEDVGEQEYKVDRMLTQLQLSKCSRFHGLKGLALGSFKDLIQLDKPKKASISSNTLRQHNGVLEDWFWLSQLSMPATLPILADIPIGHIANSRVAALGATAIMDLSAGTLQFQVQLSIS